MRIYILVLAALLILPVSDAYSRGGPNDPNMKVYNIRKAYQRERLKDAVEKYEKYRDRLEQEAEEEAAKKKEAKESQQATEEKSAPADGDTATSEAEVKPEQKAAKKLYRYDEPVEAEAEPAEEAPVEVAAEPEREPSLAISFDKRHVSFERDLRKLIRQSERSKELVHYEVISELPLEGGRGGRRNEVQYSGYQNNLNKVVSTMNSLGVDGTRIAVRSTASGDVSSQVIKIYEN